MDMEGVVGDVASMDPELLQLPELSPLALKANPCIADELFSQWLSLPDTSRLVLAFKVPSFISECFRNRTFVFVCFLLLVLYHWCQLD